MTGLRAWVIGLCLLAGACAIVDNSVDRTTFDVQGTRLLMAGEITSRTMQRGAVIGVHSWADGFGEGTDYARDRPEHRGYVAYMQHMLGSAAFYWFTLQAAPSSEIHEMTTAEISRYGLLTQPVQN